MTELSEMELKHIQDEDHDTLAVCVRNGYKHYGTKIKTVPVLEGADMSVSKGSIYGLLGASGCGKTTLLSCLIGLKKLNSGEIWVMGGAPGQKLASKIGYMPQQISLCNEFTIRESMKFFGWIAGLSTCQIEERLEFIAKLLMLPDVDSKIEHLSGGQQRRVSFATALLHEPELLILDEPTVGLDPILRESIWEYLMNIAKSKSVTIILTTHYLDEARQADKIGLMRNGSIICEESPKNLLVKFDAVSLEEAFYKVIVTENKSKMKRPRSPQTQSDVSEDRPSVSYNNLTALLWKNYKWMWRNYLFIITVCLLPIMTVFIFGIAIGGDPKHLKIGLVNHETPDTNCGVLACNSTHLSCHFLTYLDEDVVTLVSLESEEEARLSVNYGKSYASIIIKNNYTENLKLRLQGVLRLPDWKIEASTIEVIYDTSIKDIAYFMKAFFYKKFQKFMEDYLESCGVAKKTVASPVNFFPPVHGVIENSYTDFASPGVLLTMGFFLSTALTAGITMVERNEGILERSLVMGVNMLEILTAHIISQSGVMVMQCICPLLVLFLFFNITLKGSMVLVTCFTLMSGLSGMCAGFAVSSWCVAERSAAYLLLGTFLPTIVVSGIIWPLEAMNYYLKIFAYSLPLTIPVKSLRNVIQKGWGFEEPSVYDGLIIINVWTVIFLIISCVGLWLRKS